MLLTLSTTHQPATDLGFLLHKNPARLHTIEVPQGRAFVHFPVADDELCTAAIQVYVDPVRLVRRDSAARGFGLAQYVNDRPYSLSSFMSVALGTAFGTAMSGRCKDRPELAETSLPFTVVLHSVDAKDAADLVPRLFEPLGYQVESLIQHPIDSLTPDWGPSDSWTISLNNVVRMKDLLRHLTVLLPVLDDDKHYWSNQEEISKLLRRGEGWLEGHPERELIATRYLRHQHVLVRDAIERLSALDDQNDDENSEVTESTETLSLHSQRLDAAAQAIFASGARRVLDLGCGEGRLIERLLQNSTIEYVFGVDASQRALQKASRRLHLDRERQSRRLELAFGVLTYRDSRFNGYDAAALVEVIEHLDEPRLVALERSIFSTAKPRTIVVTSPNSEYNELFSTMTSGAFRHRDHRFEWSRAEFADWATGVAERNDYRIEIQGIGEMDPDRGHPSQMAIFSKESVSVSASQVTT